jgi:hypothetical protein
MESDDFQRSRKNLKKGEPGSGGNRMFQTDAAPAAERKKKKDVCKFVAGKFNQTGEPRS